MSLKKYYALAGFFSLIIMQNVFAQSTDAGAFGGNLEELKAATTQWGTTFAAGAVIVTASIAVSSLILPWQFLKETLGRKAWMGLILSIILYIVLSFFGTSIKTYVSQIYTCPLSIIGLPCG